MSLKYGILGLLNQTPMTGYNLKKLFDKSINHIWTASLSQIYRELTILEKEGYVSSHIQEQDDRPDKKIYSISDEGRTAFREWLKNFSDTFISPKRDEFMLRLFFGINLGKAEVRKQLERFIDDRKKSIIELNENEKLISQLTCAGDNGDKDCKSEEELYLRFVLKRALMTNQVLIQWAEEYIKELDF